MVGTVYAGRGLSAASLVNYCLIGRTSLNAKRPSPSPLGEKDGRSSINLPGLGYVTSRAYSFLKILFGELLDLNRIHYSSHTTARFKSNYYFTHDGGE